MAISCPNTPVCRLGGKAMKYARYPVRPDTAALQMAVCFVVMLWLTPVPDF